MAKKSTSSYKTNVVDKPFGAVPRMSAQDKKYQAEDDLRTLKRTEEIRSDLQRLKYAKATAALEIKALAKVAK
ncbi:MAG: hypothetical protein U1E51_07670 [Candidatus Binatia bacterium]|nr:hypothetical protein [Candidatus Binatia bacterium]